MSWPVRDPVAAFGPRWSARMSVVAQEGRHLTMPRGPPPTILRSERILRSEPDNVTAMASDTASLRTRLSRLWRRTAGPASSTEPTMEPARSPVGYPGDFAGTPDLDYSPKPDGRPDPGEIVWTWVPYEEDHSRGKDRPVLVVGRDGDRLLGLMLSSQDYHHCDPGWLGLGAGAWDGEHRPSWVRLDRVIEVQEDGIRREGAVLDRSRFGNVAAALRRDHGWR
jgi:hypothetical protein